MRILFLSSGYFGIYQHFENCILSALKQEGHYCRFLSVYQSLGPSFPSFQSKVKHFQPDLVLTLNGFVLSEEVSSWLATKNIHRAVWMTEDPYYLDLSKPIIHRYEDVFTIDSAALSLYKEWEHRSVHLLPLGTDPHLLDAAVEEETSGTDLCLVGFPYPDRISLITALLQDTDYTIAVAGGMWRELLKEEQHGGKLTIYDWISPKKASTLYKKSKIILNTHRPADLDANQNSLHIQGRSINNRTFDVALCGGFQLISDMPDLRTYYTEEEMISFTTYDELLSLIHFYMKEDVARTHIACAAQKTTQARDTFLQRIRQLLQALSINKTAHSFLSCKHQGRLLP
ncbi:protein CgeB [Fictibacillus macauensis ZFHKF-1]|uniref:Protein CgeB n=1 Tax=Fictibacillus macauensis ZFHKF-1 TaxID=1196324 RepID=I8UCI3_9BACL|nr:glycosyltransferase [Fictibacillus macauensis]EIT84635.1 protein CgeB [Fictibacillus macauensis ZFHKF-1]